MINNKGQAIVIFIVLLPVILLFVTYVFDVANMSYEKNKLDNIARNVEEEVTNSKLDENTICEFVLKNDNEITCSIKNKDGKTNVELVKEVKGLFVKVIREKYTIKTIVEI